MRSMLPKSRVHNTDCGLFAIATAYHLACGVSVSRKLEQSALRQHCMPPFPREQTAVAPIQHDVSNDNSSINQELPTFTPKDDVQEQSLADPVHILTYYQMETFKVIDSGTQRRRPCVASSFGWSYPVNRIRNDTTYYRCTHRPKTKPCLATLISRSGQIFNGRHPHNHQATVVC